MEFAGLREDGAFSLTGFRLSERTACKLPSVDRSRYRYEAKPDRNAELQAELVKLALQKSRFGHRRLHALLERLIEGRGQLEGLRSDNGTEFTSRRMLGWIKERKI